MRSQSPFLFLWDGESMVPPDKFWAKRADRRYVPGETYRLIEHHERSTNTHNHYFACLHEAWLSLPERLAERFPTVEHLRKWALIEAGFAHERSVVCPTQEHALKVAAFCRPLDEYAVVVVNGLIVKVFTPQSQSYKSMGKKDFAASKQAVLEVVSAMIGVELSALAERARVADVTPGRKGGAA